MLIACCVAACTDDGTNSSPQVPPATSGGAPNTEATSTPPTVAQQASSPTTERAPVTDLPPITTPSTEPAAPLDPGDFEAPVVGNPQRFDGVDFCAIVPTDDRSLNEAGFGNTAGPAEPLPNAPAGEPACRLEGVNVGEITFSVTPRSELDEPASSRGTWELIGGNTAYVFCLDDDQAGDPACALFVALDAEHALTLFVFLPTNDLDDLAQITRDVAGVALENLPDA